MKHFIVTKGYHYFHTTEREVHWTGNWGPGFESQLYLELAVTQILDSHLNSLVKTSGMRQLTQEVRQLDEILSNAKIHFVLSA